MTLKDNFTLVNPQTGNLAFKYFEIEDNAIFDHIQRLNYYTLIWIQKGQGDINVDFSEYSFIKNQILSFAPYQPFMLKNTSDIKGVVIHFHPDFSAFISTTKKWLATEYYLITFTSHLIFLLTKLLKEHYA